MKKVFIIVMLVILAALGYLLLMTKQQAQQDQVKARPKTNVVITELAMGPIREEVEALGTAQANESVILTAKVSDIITQFNFNDGDTVQKDQLLIQLHDKTQVAQAKMAKVQLQEQLREWDRIQPLVASQTIAIAEQDKLQTAIDTARAQLSTANIAVTDRQIHAPFSGKLGLRRVSVGALVSPGDEITTLDDISIIKLDFSVPERFLNDLQVGLQVEAITAAFDEQPFYGKITAIDSRVDPVSRSVRVRSEIPNPEGQLLPGMLMKVKLIKTQRQALILPESAIIPIQDRHYVYLVDDSNTVTRQRVQLGIRKRGWVEITQGLKLNQRVIIRGLLKVRPGDQVTTSLSEEFSFLDYAKVEPVA